MTYAFDGDTFGQFLGDAERLLALAREQERELSSLADLVEGEAVIEEATVGVGVATTMNVSVEAVAANALVETVGRLRLAAAEQRHFVEAMITRVLGKRAAAGAGQTRPRLLIVDDSDANRETTAAILEEAGFDVLTATNGLEGVIVAHFVRPSVILMDLTMPVLNGLEAARLIHASSATQDLKVIAYTARPDLFDGTVTKWFAEVILKPASPEAIVARVRKVAASEPRA
jgi:CheY-like chemotaxis protein